MKKLKLEDFKKFHLGYGSTNFFYGGVAANSVGCVDCAGNTTYCPNTNDCKTITCPHGNDIGGDEALGCASK